MIPEIICHIMGAVDGRLLPSRWTPPFDGTPSGELFAEYAALGKLLGADAWMFGKATTREMFPGKFVGGDGRHPRAPKVFAGRRDSERLFITVDPEADINFTSGTLRGDNIVVVVGLNATEGYLARLEELGISYIVMADPSDLRGAMKILGREFGVRRVSLQGGGIIDGAMLAAGLISELSLVVYPGIDGLASAPSIFEYQGGEGIRPAAGQSLELLSAEVRAHGVVWLRYRFHH